MKDQEISNQIQSTTQYKRVELGRKMLKKASKRAGLNRIPNRVIYMAASTFKN